MGKSANYIPPSDLRSGQPFRSYVGPHPDLGNGLPFLTGDFSRTYPSYFLDIRLRKNNARREQGFNDLLEIKDEFEAKMNDLIRNFDPLLTDYDKEFVLPNTCALSMVRPTHNDLDEKGVISSPGSNFKYSSDVLDAVRTLYAPYIAKGQLKDTITLPRGKFLGWPTMATGMSRQVNDTLLAWHATMVQGFKARKMSLASALTFLEGYHGPCFQLYGERLQHTNKMMPLIANGSVTWSRNFLPRVRSIWMAPKVAVIWNKKSANFFVDVFLKCPFHTQDRPSLQTQVESLLKTHDSFAVDVSGFDRSHGGARGEQLLRLLCEMSPHASFDDINTEWNIPAVTYFNGKMITLVDKPILWSGFSHTTVIGTIGNICGFIAAFAGLLRVQPSEVVAMIKRRDLVPFAWGDDLMVFTAKHLNVDMDALKLAYKEFANLDVDEEAVLRFLGTNYSKGRYDGSMDVGYPIGRAIQQQMFPERVKMWPFSEVGYWARLQLISESKRSSFHDIMLEHYWDEDLLGPRTSLSNWADRLPILLVAVEKFSYRISQMDDILQMLTHGLAYDDVSTGSGELDMFLDALRGSSADMTKPEKLIEEHEEIARSMLPLIKKFKLGDLSVYNSGISTIATQFKFSYSLGDVLF
jgi:hypothetical protein